MKIKTCSLINLYLLGLVLFPAPSAYADCRADCSQPTSCKEYVACQVAESECISACVQAEALDRLAASSERTSSAQVKAIEELSQSLKDAISSINKVIESLAKNKEGY